MKFLLSTLFFLMALSSLTAQDSIVKHGRLRVQVEGVDAKGGEVRIALQSSDGFLKDDGALTGLILSPLGKTNVSGRLKAMPYSVYAVAVYQDMNSNNRLDKNALGIPTEPYAFSNNPSVKWSAPTFKEASVPLNQAEQAITVQLKYWKNH